MSNSLRMCLNSTQIIQKIIKVIDHAHACSTVHIDIKNQKTTLANGITFINGSKCIKHERILWNKKKKNIHSCYVMFVAKIQKGTLISN